jgi:integrase
MRKTLSDKGVLALKPRAKGYAFPDPELVGHYVRVRPSGAKSFAAVTRNPDGRQVWTTLGGCDLLSIEEAREQAREVIKRVRDGLPAIAPRSSTFKEIAEQWLTRHVLAKGLRSQKDVARILNRYAYPTWANRPLVEIRRSDIVALLDGVEDHHGARQADYVLAIVRSVMNWHAIRADDYNPPIVRGMKRQSAKEQSRKRILDDHEIVEVWNACGDFGAFGGIMRMCLLTGQRLRKVSMMRWADVVDGVWIIPTEDREKGNAEMLKLPPLALAVIESQPRLASSPYVFAGLKNGAFCGFGIAKSRLDAKLGSSVSEPWVIHDLRRTARSLMSRAGVRPDVAERVLGHAIAGVAGVYDRHAYEAEKADALAKLAALIDSIVRGATVLPMRRKRRA